ncbi:nitric oxide reductase FlRd-NAD(+) reductase [Proteus vulgaris]|uniref:NADH:flavorubredoxin reductase NorW n=1 Tax=Proteus TaxID=583 RepID=UPI0015981AA7|nr:MULTISPECIES: NADH:flavorubredoxin reductase NorW [Proteus]MBG2711622.1 NADH:flavorubredoxin reductase NorW [Proteus mirabilis]MBG2768107.1 NADH:flavorubredoxin reductase NorW [Proteus mirabilis]QKJ49413.1 NADH:flavorubredoxin reductase NorW [Proteus vulgaris]GLX64198.1 nitric oxide reductase FlRd-NAD(+) reductase [Proteus vulgaris]
MSKDLLSNGIVIIGAGFAARQLVKNIRKFNADIPITLIASDSIDEYNKPDLSHVISQAQSADDLTKQTAQDFAQQYQLAIHPYTQITDINTDEKRIQSMQGEQWYYDKLILATGAKTYCPPISGHELMLTLNSQQEYRAYETQIHHAKRVLILGAGLIGTELAMDFSRAGKEVILADISGQLLSSLIPSDLSGRLQSSLTEIGVRLMLKSPLQSLTQTDNGILATFNQHHQLTVDCVIAATGLTPNIELAHLAGLHTDRGIIVNKYLQSSDKDIYALGDCAQINGNLLPFLQPIQLSAMHLAKSLVSENNAPLNLPPMIIRVKTPLMPLHLAGETARKDLTWNISTTQSGIIAKGFDENDVLRAFVVTEEQVKEAFALLRALSA